jgi:hypothetical protein
MTAFVMYFSTLTSYFDLLLPLISNYSTLIFNKPTGTSKVYAFAGRSTHISQHSVAIAP